MLQEREISIIILELINDCKTGGWRHLSDGRFYELGVVGNWWSSTPSSSNAWRWNLNYSRADVHRWAEIRSYGFSVRCVRNLTKVIKKDWIREKTVL